MLKSALSFHFKGVWCLFSVWHKCFCPDFPYRTKPLVPTQYLVYLWLQSCSSQFLNMPWLQPHSAQSPSLPMASALLTIITCLPFYEIVHKDTFFGPFIVFLNFVKVCVCNKRHYLRLVILNCFGRSLLRLQYSTTCLQFFLKNKKRTTH